MNSWPQGSWSQTPYSWPASQNTTLTETDRTRLLWLITGTNSPVTTPVAVNPNPNTSSLTLITWEAAVAAMTALDSGHTPAKNQAIADYAAASQPLVQWEPTLFAGKTVLKFHSRQGWLNYMGRVAREHITRTSAWRKWEIELQDMASRDFNPSGVRIMGIPFDAISLFLKNANIELTPELYLCVSIGDATQFGIVFGLKIQMVLSPNYSNSEDDPIELISQDCLKEIQFELPRLIPGVMVGQTAWSTMGSIPFYRLEDLDIKLDDGLLALQHIIGKIAMNVQVSEPPVITSSAQILK